MKVNTPEDPGSPRVWGKEILIVIVVICSALSFSLGYFVGLDHDDNKPESTMPAVVPAAVVQTQATAKQEDKGKPAADGPQQPEPSSEKASSPLSSKSQETVSGEAPAAATPLKAAGQKTASPKKDSPVSASKDVPAAANDQDTLYTVQLGAIRNPVEARRLKELLAKKGFKATIVMAKNTKNEKIYKVRTGEFTERKDAEVLALRLKKSEGLKAFVTPKNE